MNRFLFPILFFCSFLSAQTPVAIGNALNNDEMTSAGVMGYCMESEATNEYWFNRNGDNFPAAYGDKISCITWGSMIQYITYFGPEPIFVHGIQYLPVLPSSYYLVKNAASAKKESDFMINNSTSSIYSRFKTRDTWDPEWAGEVMRYRSMFDPDWSIDWYEELWNKNDEKATNDWFGGLTYYQIYANKSMGQPDWKSYIATPNSAVFYNADKQIYTYSAFNTSSSVQYYNVYKDGIVIGKLRVPGNSFYSTNSLDGNIVPDVKITSPQNSSVFNTSSVNITATATDEDGSVSKVEFYHGSTLLGTSTNAPFNITLTNLKDGVYSIYAKAFDDKQATNVSDMIIFTVDLPADTCRYSDTGNDFTATMTGKANPVVTFKPGNKIAGCQYVIVAVKKNGNVIGSWYMTKSGNNFTSTLNAAIGDKLEMYFTYQTPPSGERNSGAFPFIATTGECGVTGLKIQGTNPEINISPNPSKGDFFVTITGYKYTENLCVSISDLSGKYVIHDVTSSTNSDGVISINFQDIKFAPGIYFLHVRCKNHPAQIQKIIIK